MLSGCILNDFIVALIHNKGQKTIKRISEDMYYDKDYLPRQFKQFYHRTSQYYMNYCRIIFILNDFINGDNISFDRQKYNYTENAFNKALHIYKFPSISKIKGDSEMKDMIRKEYEKIKLISILSNAKKPIKAKMLGDLCQYIEGFRKSKQFCICSKPGPKGGYFLSINKSDISYCEIWVNNWRKSMNIDNKFSLV